MTKAGRLLLAILILPPGHLATGQPATPTGALASIAAIKDDFQRNALLYRLTASANEADLRRLFAELEQQPSTPHRYDIARMLYIRFVAVAPAAAARHACGRAGKPSWIDAVFRAWAHVDLEAAVAYASGLDGEAKRVAAGAILELELAAEQRAFVIDSLQLAAEGPAQRASAWSSRTSATDDMAAAWNRALKAGANSRDQLEAVAAAWAASEPRRAMAMAAKLDHSLRHYMKLVIIGEWNKDDPTGPIQWLETAAAEDRSAYLIQEAMAHLARSSLDAALAKVDELPPAMREPALQGVFEFMTTDQPERAFEHFGSLDFTDQVAVLIQVAGFAPAHRDSIAWVNTIDPKLQDTALGIVLNRMHIADRSLALRMTEEISNARLKAHWARALVPREVRRDPHEAWRWATSLPTDLQEASGAINVAFATWYSIDRDSAASRLLALRNSPVRNQGLLAAIRDFANKPSKYDRSLINRFFNAISDADIRREAASVLREHYTTADPNPVLAERYTR